jgi:hypothetical protein
MAAVLYCEAISISFHTNGNMDRRVTVVELAKGFSWVDGDKS